MAERGKGLRWAFDPESIHGDAILEWDECGNGRIVARGLSRDDAALIVNAVNAYRAVEEGPPLPAVAAVSKKEEASLCPECGGAGEVPLRKEGKLVGIQTCPRCHGDCWA